MNNRAITPKIIFFLFAFLCTCLFSKYVLISYLSLILFFVWISYYLIEKPQIFAKYIAFSFQMAAAVFGVYMCEFQKVYISELGRNSEFHGSIPYVVYFYFLLFTTITIFDKNRVSYQKYSEEIPKYVLILNVLVIVMYLIMWIHVINKPAFLLGLNRFGYSLKFNYTEGIYGLFSSIALPALLFPIVSISYGYKKLGIVSIVIYCLYTLWIGSKFGTFFSIVSIFVVVYYDNIIPFVYKYKSKFLIFAGISIAAMILIAIFIESFSGNSGIEYFRWRSAAQGELWWSSYEKYYGNPKPDEFYKEIRAIFSSPDKVSDNIGADYGIYGAMYRAAPKALADNKLRGGSRYTEAGFAAVYYYFGFLGCLLFSIICGIVFAVTINSIVINMSQKRYIRSFLLLRLFIIERDVLIMFLFKELFDTVSLITYAVLIFSFAKPISVRIKEKEIIRL